MSRNASSKKLSSKKNQRKKISLHLEGVEKHSLTNIQCARYDSGKKNLIYRSIGYAHSRIVSKQKSIPEFFSGSDSENTISIIGTTGRNIRDSSGIKKEYSILVDDLLFEEEDLIGGTVEGIINHVTGSNAIDTVFIEVFILTHHYFIDSFTLLTELINRFYAENISENVQLRIITVIKKWLQIGYSQLKTDMYWTVTLQNFITKNAEMPWITMLTNILDLHAEGEEEKSFFSSITDIVPESVLDLDLEEVATQLTFQDIELLKNVSIAEYMDKAWDKPQNSPNLTIFIKHFNNVGYWVATEIMNGRSPKVRAKVIDFFASLMEILIDMRNFHGMMKIYAGLNLHPVSRLKYTWKYVSTHSTNLINDVTKMMDSNAAGYKEILASTESDETVIPYHALILNELSGIEEFDTYFPNDIVNWSKMEVLAKIFSKIVSLKNTPTGIKEFPLIHAYIQTVPVLNEDELYIASRNIEPDRSSSQVKVDLVSPEERSRPLDSVIKEDHLYISFYNFCNYKRKSDFLISYCMIKNFFRRDNIEPSEQEINSISLILRKKKSRFPKNLLKNPDKSIERYIEIFERALIIIKEKLEKLLELWKEDYYRLS